MVIMIAVQLVPNYCLIILQENGVPMMNCCNICIKMQQCLKKICRDMWSPCGIPCKAFPPRGFTLLYQKGTACIARIILGMGSASERRRYIVTSSLIGWVHNQTYPCIGTHLPVVITGYFCHLCRLWSELYMKPSSIARVARDRRGNCLTNTPLLSFYFCRLF